MELNHPNNWTQNDILIIISWLNNSLFGVRIFAAECSSLTNMHSTEKNWFETCIICWPGALHGETYLAMQGCWLDNIINNLIFKKNCQTICYGKTNIVKCLTFFQHNNLEVKTGSTVDGAWNRFANNRINITPNYNS